MTKHEIAQKILDLTNCNSRSIIVAILNLASEVEKDAKNDEAGQALDWSEQYGSNNT